MIPAKEKTNALFSHPRQTTHGARRAEREDDRMLKVAQCLLKQRRDRALDRALCNALVLRGQHIHSAASVDNMAAVPLRLHGRVSPWPYSSRKLEACLEPLTHASAEHGVPLTLRRKRYALMRLAQHLLWDL